MEYAKNLAIPKWNLSTENSGMKSDGTEILGRIFSGNLGRAREIVLRYKLVKVLLCLALEISTEMPTRVFDRTERNPPLEKSGKGRR